MFVDFFYHLRSRGLAVSVTEWMTLTEALSRGLADSSLTRFYHLCRATCVKKESQFDLYDQCFAEFFRDAEAPELDIDKMLDWLRNPLDMPQLSPEEIARLKRMDLDELRRLFEERLKEQDKRHDGGNRWIGTGGTSPFGHGGQHPGGIRVGGSGGGRSAVQVAGLRRFRNLRSDRTLDVRQISVALRRLRRLARDGRPDELDLEGTVDATARNGGDIDLLFRPERKNTIKLLLLMDVGGSMTPHAHLSELLFSAAHKASHFKAFKYYYFHNCPYETLFTNMFRREGDPTDKVLQDYDRTWMCIVVGDAAMAPYELTAQNGAIDYSQYNLVPGLVWIRRIADRFPRSVWLNPEPKRFWNLPSNKMIRNHFEMFPLSLEGLDDAVGHLRKKRV